MEEQVRQGRTRSIGLSNFNQSQIANVYDNANIKPSNLQVCFLWIEYKYSFNSFQIFVAYN